MLPKALLIRIMTCFRHSRLNKLIGFLFISFYLVGCSQNIAKVMDESSLPEALQSKVISVAPVTIEWSSYWLREQRRDNSMSDLDELKARYENLLSKAFAEKLQAGGWKIEDNSTVIAELSVSNMRINAPDFRGALSDLYVEDEFGSGDFSLTFKDSDSIIANYKENRRATGGIPGRLTETNRGLNYRAFEHALERFINNAHADLLKPANNVEK